MRQDRLNRWFGGAAIASRVALLLILALASCNKQSSTAPDSASDQPATSTPSTGSPNTGAPAASGPASTAPGSAADAGAADTGAPGASDSTEAPDGPELPDTVDGTPAMMSEDGFLSAYRETEGVKVLPSGLMYRVIASGSGRSPKPTDKVRVIYRGTLMDGSVFDETKPGETSQLDLATAIAGWREALPLMKEGDKWEIVVPSNLAYGEAGRDGIAPNSPLVFEIELVEVMRA